MSSSSHGDEARRALGDPVAVHANMLSGVIAKPSIDNIIHLYGRDAFLAALRADPVRAAEEMEDEQAARRIVSARLAADTDGHGSVDIALKAGRRVLLSLDAPHLPANQEEALKKEILALCSCAADDMRRQAIAACEAEIQQIIDMGARAGTCAGYGRITAGNIIHRIKRLPTQPAAEGGAE